MSDNGPDPNSLLVKEARKAFDKAAGRFGLRIAWELRDALVNAVLREAAVHDGRRRGA